MLLTIHNLPSSTRYADVKTLLQEKCGVTEVIVDNLVNEGKSKKVTVGLASDDDGAFVVRKLNGLFINGQQLYIEDRRRPSADQPFRPACFEPDQSSNIPAMAPAWNQAATPYMQPIVDQNLAYSGYGGVPLATPYVDPIQISAEIPAYSGYQGEAYAPNKPRNQELGDWGRNSRDPPNKPRNQEQGEWGRNSRDHPNKPRNQDQNDWGRDSRNQPSDSFRQKRRHSPERPPAASKRLSRFDNFIESKNRKTSPSRQQWAEENRVFHEEFSRQNQNVEPAYQPRDAIPEYQNTDPLWEQQPRWDEPKPREPKQQRGNDKRDWQPQPAKGWDQPQQRREEPRQWDSPPKPQWDSPQKLQWESPQKQPWYNQPKPQWDNQPKPQWEERIPAENIRSEWYDHLAAGDPPRNDQDFQPRDRDRYIDSRAQNKGFDAPNSDSVWNRDHEDSYSSPSRLARSAEETRRDRQKSRIGRQENDLRDRPVAPRDHSGGRQKRDYGKPKEYPSREFKSQSKPEPGPSMSRRERDEMYRNSNRSVQEKKTYPPVQNKKTCPPVSERQIQKPFEPRPKPNKPQTLRVLINKDVTNRGQATALLAKNTIGLKDDQPYQPNGLDSVIFKQLKMCIRSRVDVLFGEELSVYIGDVVKRYRAKYPASEDKILMIQIREKTAREYEALPREKNEPKEKMLKNEAASNGIQVKNEPVVKKEKENNTAKRTHAQTKEFTANKTAPVKEGTANKNGAEVKSLLPPNIPLPPNMPKVKPGQPLTDKKVIQQMKVLRKWEYDNDDLYSMDEVKTKALDDEMAELDKVFIEECANPADKQEGDICKHITTHSLNDFNKTIRLYITKRFLNITTGLAIRMFASGKPPKKDAVLQYLKKHKIVASAVRKSVKGGMFMINLTKFEDFDKLCNIDNDVIDGIPVNFRALHLIGPPPKMSKNQVKTMRQKMINDQIEDLDMDELEDVDFGGGVAGAGEGATGNREAVDEEAGIVDTGNVADEDFAKDELAGEEYFAKDIGETEDFTEDLAETEEFTKDFAEEVNIDNINEEDLEDF